MAAAVHRHTGAARAEAGSAEGGRESAGGRSRGSSVAELKSGDGVLSVKIRFHNKTGTPVNFYVLGTNISYERFYLAAANKKYFILKDSDGTELAPGGDYSCGMPGVCEKLGAGQSNTWWAKFPAPSADVTKLDLFTPVTPPFEGVPITGN